MCRDKWDRSTGFVNISNSRILRGLNVENYEKYFNKNSNIKSVNG